MVDEHCGELGVGKIRYTVCGYHLQELTARVLAGQLGHALQQARALLHAALDNTLSGTQRSPRVEGVIQKG